MIQCQLAGTSADAGIARCLVSGLGIGYAKKYRVSRLAIGYAAGAGRRFGVGYRVRSAALGYPKKHRSRPPRPAASVDDGEPSDASTACSRLWGSPGIESKFPRWFVCKRATF